jgi:hypothetical protein
MTGFRGFNTLSPSRSHLQSLTLRIVGVGNTLVQVTASASRASLITLHVLSCSLIHTRASGCGIGW